MKNILGSIFFFISCTGFCQSYTFDYHLEYTHEGKEDVDVYINSNDPDYLLADGGRQFLVNKDSVLFYSNSLKGIVRRKDQIPRYPNDDVKIEEIKLDEIPITYNGFNCKKYKYKLSFFDESGTTAGIEFYEIYITEELNSLEAFNRNDLAFPESIKFVKAPKGTIVKAIYYKEKRKKEKIYLSLKKINKLEKPLTLNL